MTTRRDPTQPDLPTRERRAFQLAERAARRAIRRRFRLASLTKDAYVKIDRHGNALGRLVSDLTVLVRLARAWASKEYRDVPWQSVVFVVAAIIYFVNPVDLVPDLLTGIGFVDDAAVIGAVIRSVHDDLVSFRQWERSRQRSVTRPASVTSLHAPASAAA